MFYKIDRQHRFIQEPLFATFLYCLLFLLLFAAQVTAQEQSLEQITARQSLRSATHALVALVSDDSLNAGSYKFKNESGSDPKMSLYKFNFEFPLSGSDSEIVPLLEISPAYLELEQDIQNDKLEINTKGFGVGAGVRLRLFDGMFELVPRLKLEYSKLDNSYRSSSEEESELSAILNSKVEVFSVLPSLEAILNLTLGDRVSCQVGSDLSYVYNEASSAESALGDFTDDGWVLKNSLSLAVPLRPNSELPNVIIRPTVSRIDVYGAVRDGFEFNNFYEIGFDLFSEELFPDYLAELGFGLTYVYEKEIQGWRFGVIAKLS